MYFLNSLSHTPENLPVLIQVTYSNDRHPVPPPIFSSSVSVRLSFFSLTLYMDTECLTSLESSHHDQHHGMTFAEYNPRYCSVVRVSEILCLMGLKYTPASKHKLQAQQAGSHFVYT